MQQQINQGGGKPGKNVGTIANHRVRFMRDVFFILLGTMMASASINMFLVPAKIVSGGVTGVAQIFQYLWGWPLGISAAALNLPLFLLGYRVGGTEFVVKTGIATLFWSFVLDLLPVPAITLEPLLAGLYGGVGMGAGIGLVFRFGASTGGTDMAAQVVHRRIPSISASWILFGVDCAVVLASVFIFGIEKALYAMVALFVSSKAIDVVQEGFNSSRAFHIITTRPDAIARRAMNEMERGCTALRSIGMYSKEERLMLLIVVRRLEVTALKRIVHEEDPSAFFIIADVAEVLGEGFDERKMQPDKKRAPQQP